MRDRLATQHKLKLLMACNMDVDAPYVAATPTLGPLGQLRCGLRHEQARPLQSARRFVVNTSLPPLLADPMTETQYAYWLAEYPNYRVHATRVAVPCDQAQSCTLSYAYRS